MNSANVSTDFASAAVKDTSSSSLLLISSDADWSAKSSSIQTWIKSNPLNLGVPSDGTIDTITAQLKRGETHTSIKARNKAWLHILLEMSSCAGAEVLGSLFAVDLSASVGEKLDVVFGKGGSNLSSTVVDAQHKAPAAAAAAAPPGVPPLIPASNNEENVPPPSTPVLRGGAKSIFALRASHETPLAPPVEAAGDLAGDLAAEASASSSSSESDAVAAMTNPNVKRPAVPTLKTSNMVGNGGGGGGGFSAPGSQSARTSEAGDFTEGLRINVGILNRGISNSGIGSLSARESPMKEDPIVEKKSLSQMSMIERQVIWMAKKAQKALEQKKSAEDAVRATIMAPDIGASKKSFTGVKAKVEAGLLAAAAIAASNAEKEKKAAAEQQQAAAELAAQPRKEQQIKKKTRSKSVSAAPTSSAANAEAANIAAIVEIFSPTTAISSRRNTCSDINQYGIGNYQADAEKNTALLAGEAFPVMRVGLSASTPSLTTPSADSASSPAKEQSSSSASSDFKTGSFFSRVDTESNRGHFRVRDGAAFSMASMYRKRDKHSKMGASVALLVGREENGAGDEKAIEVLFDLGTMTEEAAKKWWDTNQERFLTPRK